MAAQDIVDVLPASGGVEYTALRDALTAAGKPRALNDFHSARRSGAVETRFELRDGKRVLLVGRPGAFPAEGAQG